MLQYHISDASESLSREIVLPPGCSKTLYDVDAAVRSHRLHMKITGCKWVAIPLTCDKEKKVYLDLYQERKSGGVQGQGQGQGQGQSQGQGQGFGQRQGFGGREGEGEGEREGEGQGEGAIYCTLRAHSTSHLSSEDVTLSIPSSSPALLSHSTSSSSSFSASFSTPTASSMHLPIRSPPPVTVTEITVYSEAVLISRTGKPLRVRTMRKGSYVQRNSYSAAVEDHYEYDRGVGGSDSSLENQNPGPSNLRAVSSKSGLESEVGSGSGSLDGDGICPVQGPLSQMGMDGRDICLYLKEEMKCRRENNRSRSHVMTGISALAEDRADNEYIAAAVDRMQFKLESFTLRSRRRYHLMKNVQVGDTLYTDRPQLKWAHLHPILK